MTLAKSTMSSLPVLFQSLPSQFQWHNIRKVAERFSLMWCRSLLDWGDEAIFNQGLLGK